MASSRGGTAGRSNSGRWRHSVSSSNSPAPHAKGAAKSAGDQLNRAKRLPDGAESGRVVMALRVALSDYAPKRGLQAGPPLARSVSAGERPNRNHVAASILFHLLVLFGIFLLPPMPPAEVVVPLVTLTLD